MVLTKIAEFLKNEADNQKDYGKIIVAEKLLLEKEKENALIHHSIMKHFTAQAKLGKLENGTHTLEVENKIMTITIEELECVDIDFSDNTDLEVI